MSCIKIDKPLPTALTHKLTGVLLSESLLFAVRSDHGDQIYDRKMRGNSGQDNFLCWSNPNQ
jgi:hypothetical protein